MSQEDVKQAIMTIMYFDTDELLEEVLERISEGKSVVLLTELYMGAGRWKLSKYKYKMIVPVLDKHLRFYSTDVFEFVQDALEGEYGIYSVTRQNAKKIMCSLDADTADSRFGFGYTEEDYGRNLLMTNKVNSL